MRPGAPSAGAGGRPSSAGDEGEPRLSESPKSSADLSQVGTPDVAKDKGAPQSVVPEAPKKKDLPAAKIARRAAGARPV